VVRPDCASRSLPLLLLLLGTERSGFLDGMRTQGVKEGKSLGSWPDHNSVFWILDHALLSSQVITAGFFSSCCPLGNVLASLGGSGAHHRSPFSRYLNP
jgi:hypothetical protein